ncbi:hypothetical protein AVEN_144523-1 [Araneus ventricosus]|uniref:Uncharacterized protein n=1 Tax=Araneus ventricosus TaxID=182803 RepID=A0A4Y2W277_ARAVE|nr:hypothetical protein AVEN_144523-1 [Araneus ventricosus]
MEIIRHWISKRDFASPKGKVMVVWLCLPHLRRRNVSPSEGIGEWTYDGQFVTDHRTRVIVEQRSDHSLTRMLNQDGVHQLWMP